METSSTGDPDIYLVSKLKKMRLDNGVWEWSNIRARYVKESVAELADVCWRLPKKKAENPFIGDYAPYMDETLALDQDLAYWYQSFIGMLNWMV